MSEASQGPGWWVASDGQWYPPEMHPDFRAQVPPPPPPQPPPVVASPGPGSSQATDGQWYPSTQVPNYQAPQSSPQTPTPVQPVYQSPVPQWPVEAPKEPKKKGSGPKIAAIVSAAVVIIVIIAVVAGSHQNSNPNPSTGSANSGGGSSSASATTDPTAAASAAYVSAYNAMVNAENPEITAQNADGGNPTALTTDLNNRISTRQTFDTAVQQITFPSSAQSDAQQVIAADAALENALGQLSANTNDTSNYNSVFASVTTAENQFAAADSALSTDLGVTTSPSSSG